MDQGAIERLLSDVRTLSPAGIERVAWGWDRHEQADADAFHAAERAALHAVEAANQGEQWEVLRRSILGLTEGRQALVGWKVEHGQTGHKAEAALLGAALGIFTSGRIDHRHYVTLVRPLAEALPWLLPEIPPQPYRPE